MAYIPEVLPVTTEVRKKQVKGVNEASRIEGNLYSIFQARHHVIEAGAQLSGQMDTARAIYREKKGAIFGNKAG